jgi:predicted secreted protein
MSKDATAGVGTLFKRGNEDSSSGAAETFTAIGEINSITGPSKTRDTIDVTDLDSTDGYREFIGSFRDGGEVSLGMNFKFETYDDMNDDFESDTLRTYQIVLPDTGNTTFTFEALVTSLGLAVPMDDKITADVTLKISGSVTLES